MPLPEPNTGDPANDRNFRDLDERLSNLLNRTSLTGDYSDGTVLASLVALLEAKGILEDNTTA